MRMMGNVKSQVGLIEAVLSTIEEAGGQNA
jgi:hypothetical protein